MNSDLAADDIDPSRQTRANILIWVTVKGSQPLLPVQTLRADGTIPVVYPTRPMFGYLSKMYGGVGTSSHF